jgi:hypothetical protein
LRGRHGQQNSIKPVRDWNFLRPGSLEGKGDIP